MDGAKFEDRYFCSKANTTAPLSVSAVETAHRNLNAAITDQRDQQAEMAQKFESYSFFSALRFSTPDKPKFDNIWEKLTLWNDKLEQMDKSSERSLNSQWLTKS